jgi:murein DD-endopeptidase MepM/ murein hydrolase activator NlpD
MRVSFFVLFVLSFSLVVAQPSEKYLFPIQPGQVASLAGNMGELRSNHFHTGIDIRTNNQVGIPVLASKSGYVSRAAMTSGGYGNVLYVTHPDGNTTLYAHLDSFAGAVKDYVRQEQYRRKFFEIELYFRENQFAVKQGDTIALSGNTGSSSGPHLHFDIRDKDNKALDPLSFGFAEVVDNAHPYAEKLALRTLTIDSRINDQFGRTEFYVVRNGNEYILPNPILANGSIGIELLAKDKLANPSAYYGGVNKIEVYANNSLIFKQAITTLDLSEGRAINSLLSFRSLRGTNSKFYKLYIDDGNTLPFYGNANGKISLAPNETVSVRIQLKDVFGNTSHVSFTLKGSTNSRNVIADSPPKNEMTTTLWDNTLLWQVNTPIDSNKTVIVHTKGKSEGLLPSYGGKYTSTYLHDLRKSIPDSVTVANQTYRTLIEARVPSGTEYTFYSNDADVHFPKGALYDTLYFQVNTFNKKTTSIQLGDAGIPLHKFIGVTWRVPRLPAQWDSTWAVYRKVNGDLSFVGGTYTNGSLQFNTREFGIYTLQRDTIPPQIKPIVMNGTAVVCRIKDDLASIEKYEAALNGKWLLMHLDGKTGTLKAERLDTLQPFAGEFVLTVTDRCGNKTTIKQKIL